MEKHTPGPWTIVKPGDDDANCRQKQIAICGGVNFLTPVASLTAANGAKEANARLIAAAPDLIEALKVLTKHAQETYPHFESPRGQIDINVALAAIAKATT